MAILREDFFAVPDGEIYPRMFRAGETVSGQVKEAAIRMGKVIHDVAPASTIPHSSEDAKPRRGRPSKVKAMTAAPESK
jgi:hypothetical protein